MNATPRWYQRPIYVAVLAFVAGVAVAAIILVLLLRDDDGGTPSVQPTATAELAATPDATGASPTAAATPAPGSGTPSTGATPNEALTAFVRDEMNAEYIGECPSTQVPGDATGAICSVDLYRSDELVTVFLGAPLSEGIGEAVLTPDEAGRWTVTFVPAPPLGEPVLLVIGATAVVYGAGDCLNFRAEANPGAAVQTCQLDGARGEVAEGPVAAFDIMWWRIEGFGWASAEFLIPASE